MKIYKKCPCCGKLMFLMLGSDFGNEIELGSTFGSKDNIPHSDTNHEEDWHCLNNFLNCLNNSHGEVFISLKEREKERIPENYKKTILEWTEGGYKKPEEKTAEPPKWTGFTTQQKQDWLNIGLGENDAGFAYWLKNVKKLTPDYVLNYCDLESLRREYGNTHGDWS